MLGVASDRTKCLCAGTVIEVASGQLSVILMTLVLGVANGQTNVILMTLVLRVASDRTECVYAGSVGFGPWALGMALGPGRFRGPSKDRKES